jgi:integrase
MKEIRIYKPGTGPGTGKRAVVEIGFHSLRHSFVSMCRTSNVPLAVVESIVGHSNPAMRMRASWLRDRRSLRWQARRNKAHA